MATIPTKPASDSQSADRARSAPPCDLCGLPARASIIGDDDSVGSVFCCNGCRNVWRILSESGQIEPGVDPRGLPLFVHAQRLGLLGRTGAAETISTSDIEVTPPDEGGSLEDIRQCILRVEGMWCASCAWLIAETLRRRRGVLSADVSFASDSARVTFKPARVGVEEILESVRSLGYAAETADASSKSESDRSKRYRRELIRVAIAFSFGGMNVMMLTPILYLGRRAGVTPFETQCLNWILLVMSIPVFICAWPLFDRALRAARHGYATMETLVTVGATTAFLYSVVAVLHHSTYSYFDTADMLLGLVLVGKFIEGNIRAGATDSISLLQGLTPKKATVLHADGSESSVSVAQIAIGDLIRVRAGEIVAADGVVESGTASVDESLLTGESQPAAKHAGDSVTGGSTLQDGAIDVLVGRTPQSGALQQMASVVQDSLHHKTRSEQIADRISRVFVPLVMALAVVTAAWVYHASGDAGAAVTRAVAVLVIACPCALGIATPMAILAGVAAAAHRGIAISDPEALGITRRLKRIIFDKTGTLTEGRFRVRQILPADADLTCVTAVEQFSEHSIARAVRAYVEQVRTVAGGIAASQANGADAVTGFTRLDGAGVSGEVLGRRVFAGNARLVEMLGVAPPAAIAEAAAQWSEIGQTVIYFGAGNRVDGIIGLGDSVRSGSAALIGKLRAEGIESEIISGDASATVAAIAQSIGVAEWRGGVLPTEKAGEVDRRIAQARGGAVAMVGDGVNDAHALARADLGIALASGSEIAGKAATVTVLSSRFGDLSELIRIARETDRVIRQNLFWAFCYNLICIPLAVAGCISPIWAAAAMLVSSLAVVVNSRRLAWKLDAQARRSEAGGAAELP